MNQKFRMKNLVGIFLFNLLPRYFILMYIIGIVKYFEYV